MGHEFGRVSAGEILGAQLDALVYREYLDPGYAIANSTPIVAADRNEPPWNRRVPGTVLFARPGERLHIHVRNADPADCHSFHVHGLHYGVDADGAWPFGVRSHDGRRSDEILPGQSWTYVYEVTEAMIGPWLFYDHVRGIARNINRGLFGGLIVRDPSAPRADHEIPMFLHQMAGTGAATSFESATLSTGGAFSFAFPATPGSVPYHCAIHGPAMAGQVQIVSGGPANANVSIGDNFSSPAVTTIGPGGAVKWTNAGTNDHIVFAPGGGASQYCLNGRTYVGNTPTIDAKPGERLRWYLFSADVGDVWHNFHPHSARWQLPAPPGIASDVHSLSPAQSFVVDTEVPQPVRLPCAWKRCNATRPPTPAVCGCAGTSCFTAISKST
jgi:FtsP/CotA-like multicopper oxidase with cupredoxin domain